MASAMSASPQSVEERGSLPSPAPPQASPAAASPPQARSPHTVLATMTPVPAQDFDYAHKVEIDSNDGYPPDIVYSEKGAPLHPDVYHSDNKGAIIYQHSPNDIINYTQNSEKVVPSAMQGDMYGQDMGPIDEKTPIDLIYEDGKQTVIYTTTPDQKRVEMISGQMNDGQLITSGSQLVDAGVSVVVQGPSGQGTVLVLADHMVDELGQVISIPRRRKEVIEAGGENWRGYYGAGELLDEPPLADYCRLPPLAAHDATLPKDLKIPDVWTSSGALKQTNGAPGAELGDLQGLFHSGLVKREPEDLSRKVPDEQAESQSALKPPRHKSFDYTVICQQPAALEGGAEGGRHTPAQHSPGAAPRSRPWHDFGRQNDADKIQIPKLYSPYGFKYHLESPISSSQRREDDRITYINKGQFYGITLEYIHDPDKPIKNQTVKSVVMLMFREEKSPEDEIKAWQFWHGRQHSVKQRILDADTKNSVGLAGCIEEISHNAIAVYWNPLETLAKINVAVQCLSTDFSSQKGVKGLPLHVQIDTYEDPRDQTVFHRGYCQIKVFCDKGAERKTRDEERRAAKRKMTATGRKKLDELYHPVVERSEFYSMADLSKPPVLFSPAEDIDKIAGMDIQGFYGHDDSSLTGDSHLKGASPFLLHAAKPATPTLKFHNHFPPDTPSYRTEAVSPGYGAGSECESKRARVSPPPLSERVMLYVRQDADNVFTPLHVAPPTTQGLLHADYGQN